LVRQKDPEVLWVLSGVLATAGPAIVAPLEPLLPSPDEHLRTTAGWAIGAQGEAVFPLIRKNLHAASAFRNEAALCAIQAAGSAAKSFAAEVRPFLAHKKPAVRGAAAMAYGEAEPDAKELAGALLPLLDDPDIVVARSADAALGRHAARCLPELTGALETATGQRLENLSLIFRTLPPAVAPAYSEFLLATAPPRRALLLEYMSMSLPPNLPPDARGRVAAWAREADTATRIAALAVVGTAGWPDRDEAVRILREAARAPEATVRAAAMAPLGLFDSSPGTVKAACTDADPVVRMAAACALQRRGEPGPDPLPLCIDLLESEPRASVLVAELGTRGLPAIPALVRASRSAKCGEAARRALAELLLDVPPADAVIGRSAAFAAAPKKLQESIDRALAWLAQAQDPDGRWNSERWDGAPLCDYGVTGLALLAFLSAGHTDDRGPYADTVRRGLAFLVENRSDDGCLSTRATTTFLIQHGIATAALSEAACCCRSPGVARAAREGLEFVSMCRNPDLAWRYDPRGGDNDTFVTAWMVMALKAGEMAGLHPDAAAYAGALRWVEKMTEPNFGQAGYTAPGGLPSNPEALGSPRSVSASANDVRAAERSQSCTAAGLWVRVLAGDGTLEEPVELKALDLMNDHKPTWYAREQENDECYWHWGALAISQVPRSKDQDPMRPWREALEDALLAHQGETSGAWAPTGTWGHTGGRVFSTAMAALSLLAPYAYPTGCFAKDYRRKLYPDAYKVVGG